MSNMSVEMEIDFGEVGDRFRKEPFKVRLDASPLSQLVSDAANAYRVYELMMITRLGDVWDYVLVIPVDLPNGLREYIEELRAESARPLSNRSVWPEGDIAFADFDKLFHWSWDDDESDDIAWRRYRQSSEMAAFAKQLFTMVGVAKNNLRTSDPLLSHIVRLIDNGQHCFDGLSRAAANKADDSRGPIKDQHTLAFYKQLDLSLSNPQVASVAYRADGDYRTLRALATEQRIRANRTRAVGAWFELREL
jgi:hypothetical protein